MTNLPSIFRDLPEVFRTHSIGIDRLLDDPFFTKPVATNYPPHNVVENGNKVRLELALAGFSPDDIDVTIEDGYLHITAEKREESLAEGEAYVHKGISTKSFRKSFRILNDYKVMDASFKNGMLLVEFEKEIPEEKKPQKIEIRS